MNFILDKYEEESLSTADVKHIRAGLDDIKRGRVKRIEDLAKKFGVKLRGASSKVQSTWRRRRGTKHADAINKYILLHSNRSTT